MTTSEPLDEEAPVTVEVPKVEEAAAPAPAPEPELSPVVEKINYDIEPQQMVAEATQGNVQPVGNSNDWSVDRRASIKAMMNKKKEEDRFPLAEDVYAYLIVAPVHSAPFLFSLAVIAIKIFVYSILTTDISLKDFDYAAESKHLTMTVKFFLIPVAVAMQEDLMDSYFFFANAMYCPTMTSISMHATKEKLIFSYFLRTFDGLFSLWVNYAVMLTTDSILAVFLNFAALGFLQSIDDVFYDLAQKGFFGDSLEVMSEVCKTITLARRTSLENQCLGFIRISHVDSILLVGTLIVAVILYGLATAIVYDYLDWPSLYVVSDAPTGAPM